MSRLKILRAAQYPRMPWKNGGGSTEEISRDAGHGLDGFGWRVSIADIAESGGFSTFNGYKRVITVLQGDGMNLTIDGKISRDLLPFDPLAFSGDATVDCTLLGATIRDFNLIYAPQRYQVRLQWLDGIVPSTLFTSAQTVLVFSACDDLQIRIAGYPAESLGIYDSLQIDDQQGLLKVNLAGRCCVIELNSKV
ncbi:HutD family protein [Pseudomonas sp. dw_358]|uniref:HutD/Ves family protein n=1 Tax=Pseudomonas sp. dw_358 TaxID=2720083 RepID=UPI001BD6864C|nr:HutD family protein [Pseudomonas sp. dw_358]